MFDVRALLRLPLLLLLVLGFSVAVSVPVLADNDRAAAADDENDDDENDAAANEDDGDDESMSAEEILDHIDDLHRADSSRGKMRMEIKKEGWERTLEMEYWTQGRKQSLFRITSPARERGMATLRDDQNIWNYLPRTDRVIRLSPAMMGASWAGSHFTNNDLVRESRMAEDYEFEITFEGERRGYEVIEIKCTPKEDAPVEWGKVMVTVRAESYQPMFVVYHDEDLEAVRYITYHEIREFDDREVPSVMRVIPADARNESTTLRILEARYNVEIDDDIFSLRNLRR